MSICAPLNKGMPNPFNAQGPDNKAFVWMPECSNRTSATDTAQCIFNHIQ